MTNIKYLILLNIFIFLISYSVHPVTDSNYGSCFFHYIYYFYGQFFAIKRLKDLKHLLYTVRITVVFFRNSILLLTYLNVTNINFNQYKSKSNLIFIINECHILLK